MTDNETAYLLNMLKRIIYKYDDRAKRAAVWDERATLRYLVDDTFKQGNQIAYLVLGASFDERWPHLDLMFPPIEDASGANLDGEMQELLDMLKRILHKENSELVSQWDNETVLRYLVDERFKQFDSLTHTVLGDSFEDRLPFLTDLFPPVKSVSTAQVKDSSAVVDNTASEIDQTTAQRSDTRSIPPVGQTDDSKFDEEAAELLDMLRRIVYRQNVELRENIAAWNDLELLRHVVDSSFKQADPLVHAVLGENFEERWPHMDGFFPSIEAMKEEAQDG